MNFSLENIGFSIDTSLSDVRPWRRGLVLNFQVQRFLQAKLCGRCMWEICSNRSVVFLKGESYLAHLCVWTVGISIGFLPSTEWITELAWDTVHKTSPLWMWPQGWFLFSESSTTYQFSYFQCIVGERKMKAGLKGERWWKMDFLE